MPCGATARAATQALAIRVSVELPPKDRYHEEAQEE
jgi:hypothetical protein